MAPRPPNLADRLRPLARALRPIETAIARRCGWSPLGRLFRTPVLVLETTGRRTGRRRRTPLARHPLPDGTWLVVGGASGQRRLPDWVANLRADPRAVAVIDGEPVPVRATETTGARRAELWPVAVATWPRIVAYERRAGRPIPVITLTPEPFLSPM